MKILRLAAFVALASTSFAAQAFPIAAAGTEGDSVIVSGTGDIIATYQGNSASYSNDLLLEMTVTGTGLDGDMLNDVFVFNNHATPVGTTFNLGSFSVGTELVFRLHVNNTDLDYYTGDASRNPDGLAHARVESAWMPNESLVSFEDLYGTPEGINGYNDLSFSFTNTVGSSNVPAPAPLALVIMGMLGLHAKRRKA